MNNILGQVSYPVFLSCVFVFFILASIFSFIVGLGLAARSRRMLRFFHFMDTRISTRRLTKPLLVPHFVEPTLFRHPAALGASIMLGAVVSLLLLKDMDALLFQPIYSGIFPDQTAEILAGYTRSFLVVGNAACIVLGVILLFFPQKLSAVERRVDKWYTLRRQARALYAEHDGMEHWVMMHPTVSGVALSLLSLGLGMTMFLRLYALVG